jgi:hypothetical protein
MKYFPIISSRERITLASLVILVLIMMVIGVVAAIYVLRFALESDIGTNASVVASVLNSVQIAVFNVIYGFIAKKLTDFENNRTDSEYQDSMIVKSFCFQFVNSYRSSYLTTSIFVVVFDVKYCIFSSIEMKFSSFFFLAFIAKYLERPDYLNSTGPEADYVGECGWTDCMKPLAINLVYFPPLLLHMPVNLLNLHTYKMIFNIFNLVCLGDHLWCSFDCY